MRIYGVSCSTYSNNRNNPTFGFYQPSMATVDRSAVKTYTGKSKKLKGKLILKEIPTIAGLENFRTRHVNIKGSQNKIERTTFNHYAYDGITHKYEQDLYPDGDLITRVKKYCNGKIGEIQEYIENIK